MGNDIQKGITYSTGGIGGQGSITSANLNAHVDDAIIKPTFISTKVNRGAASLTENIIVEQSGSLYRMSLKDSIPQGAVIQTVAATPYTANTNLTTVIPADDTIPQDSEGTQILTLSIVLWYATSLVRLTYHGFGALSSTAGMATALFRAGNANALKATVVTIGTANAVYEGNLDWMDSPATTSALTYNIRVGPISAMTLRMNGNSTTRIFGGVAACTLVAQEIKG